MPKKADAEVVAQTVEMVREVAQQIEYTGEHGELARLAKTLDGRGMKTPAGGRWHYDKVGPLGLSRFIAKYMPDGLQVAERLVLAKVDIVHQVEGPADTATVDNFDEEAQALVPAVTYDKVDKRELESMLQALELRLTTLIDQRIDEAMATAGGGIAVTFDNLDLPPVPPKVGEAKKKFKGFKGDLRVRIDKNLYDLLEKDVKAHFGHNWSRALDAVLWRYYGRPKLSFEE